MPADHVLSSIFGKLRNEPYYSEISRHLHEQVRAAYQQRSSNEGDGQFISNFVETRPDLFLELTNAIDQIFRQDKQFEICRNPDLKPPD
jgi:hypothetical protein